MAKMLAAVCHEPHNLTLEKVDRPEPGPGQAVVRVRATGVCGSDVDGYLGRHPWIHYPIILGHECSGLVDAVGPGVENWAPGDAVVVEPFFVCEECPACRRGKYNLCREIDILGHGRPGAFAEYVLIDERFLHPLPKGVSFEQGALAEPVSGSLHAVERCNLSIGDFVVLMGCGTIGYFALQHVLNSGAGVLVSEPNERKRETAEDMGADHTLDPAAESLEDRVLELTDGMGADCVIEAVGRQETIRQSVSLARKGGTIMLIGWTGEDTDPFNCTRVTLDEMTVLGTMGFASDYPVVLDLLASGKVDAESIITHLYSLEDTKAALETLHERREGIWKALIVMD